MQKLTKLLTLISSACVVGTASAETAPMATSTTAVPAPADTAAATESKRPTHDHARVGALFSRARLGVGHLVVHTPTGVGEVTSSGIGPSGTLVLGATVLPGLALYGQVSLHRLTNPKLEANGESFETKGMKMDQLWLGPGITYYFAPVNVFVSASVAASMVTTEVEGLAPMGKSKLGPALSLEVGKEWWIANRLGLGISAQAVWATMKDRGAEDATITSRGITLAASLTYN